MNKVMLVGRLTRDPELRSLPSGKHVSTFTIATNEFRGGGNAERTEYHPCVAWDRLAEITGQFLSKGQLVDIEGRLQTRQWDDDAGKGQWATSRRGSGGGRRLLRAPQAQTCPLGSLGRHHRPNAHATISGSSSCQNLSPCDPTRSVMTTSPPASRSAVAHRVALSRKNGSRVPATRYARGSELGMTAVGL